MDGSGRGALEWGAMRFRPRFSVRTLVIFVMLACASYLGAWIATKTHAARQKPAIYSDGKKVWAIDDPIEKIMAARVVSEGVETFQAESPAPFVMTRHERPFSNGGMTTGQPSRCFYVWLFGPEWKLPFEADGD